MNHASLRHRGNYSQWVYCKENRAVKQLDVQKREEKKSTGVSARVGASMENMFPSWEHVGVHYQTLPGKIVKI